MRGLSRREFTKSAAIAGLGAAIGACTTNQQFTTSRAAATTRSSDRIRIGFIGVGNRGDQVLSAFLSHKDADVVAVCDIHQPYVDFAARKVGTDPAQYKDYRRILDRDDIDAVVINTPDHWHALQMIHACQAGKDVYVEKPLSLTITEGRAMVDAAKRYQRVTQVGIQRRSSASCKEMCDFIRSGGIGKVTVARAFHIQNEFPNGIGRPADSAPPADLDWESWLGPAPYKPYNKNRGLYRFRWFYDYSGGQLTNMGVHYIDLIHWALGETAPASVAALGGKLANYDNREIPDTMEVMWTYPSNTLVTFSQYNATGAAAAGKPCELEFRGTKGTLYFRGNGYEVVPEEHPQREFPILNPLDRSVSRGWREDRKTAMEPRQTPGSHDPTAAHARNFLDCIKSRNQCACDIETGHRSTSATLLANIAHKTHSVLDWDAKRERITNNSAANKLLHYKYRRPYELPRV